MSYGIQVANIYGETQIDGFYKNFQVLSFGTSSPSTGTTYGGLLCPVYAQFDTKNPVVMARPINDVGGLVSCCSYFYPTNTMNIQGFYPGTIQTAIKYVILEPTAVPPAGSNDYGIEIYDQLGGVVFSSRRRNFIIDAVITLVSNSWMTTHTVTLPPVEFGKRYYQMLVRWGHQADQEGFGVAITELSATTISVDLQEGQFFAGTRTVSFITGYFRE